MIVLQALWLLLPAGFANMAPIWAQKLFPRWNTAIDRGRLWQNKEILGAHKTYRGFISGILAGTIIFLIQKKLLILFPQLSSLSLLDYKNLSPLFGALMGFAALAGDLLKSFFKRRLQIASGSPWIPFDEIDWIIGDLVCVAFVYPLNGALILSCLISGALMHFVIRRLAFLIKIVSSPL